MAVSIASIRRENQTIVVGKSYKPFIHDYTCTELSNCAQELNLGCLQYLDGAGDCIFNYDQCQTILNKEIPVLRARELSRQAQEALDGIEYAIKDSNDPYGFLLFEGD